MRCRRIGVPLLIALALTALATPGCNSAAPKSTLASTATPERILLRNFVDFFTIQVGRAADSIAQNQTDPAISRNTVYWKLRMIPMAQRALLLADDQAAALQLWLLSASQLEALGGPTGLDFMGAQGQPLAVAACQEILDDADELASTLLTPQQYAAAKPRLLEFARQHTGTAGLEMSGDDVRKWTNTMSGILEKPFHMLQAPLSSLNPVGGLSDTALAVQNFTDQFTLARMHVDYMPQELRWNAQLLLMEAAETVKVNQLVKSVTDISASATSLAETARTLPADVRAELHALVTDLDEHQADLQATLQQLDTTITDTESAARALDAMGASFTGMFDGFTKVMATFESDPGAPPTPPERQGPPFDINDYGRTADKLTATAQALTALLTRADALAGAGPPPLVTDTEAALRALIDRIFLYAAGLVVFTALTALVYRKVVGPRVAA